MTSPPAGPGPAPPPGSLREAIARFGDRLAREPHLVAVRDGVVAALPLVLIGSFFLLLAQPPSERLQALVAPYLKTLVAPQKMLTGLISIYVCFAAARSLARHFALDELSVPLMALASFMTAHSAVPLAAEAGGGWGVAAERLGAGGLFGALFTALASVHLQRLLIARRWTIRLPGGAPDAIVKSFASIVPGFASIGLVWLVVHVLRLDYVVALGEAARPLLRAQDTAGGALLLSFVDSGLWLLGVHPLALMAVLKPGWLALIAENQQAAAAGLALPHIATREFFLWFVWQGGSGGTLAVAIHLFFFARSAMLKTVGRLGYVPALFNINEPILFGLPIVMNPKLALPFVLAPAASCAVAFGAMSAGLVNRPRLDVLWTLPAPMGAYLTTGGDPRAVFLQMTTLVLSILIWWPFLRAYDRELLAREQAPCVPPDPGSAQVPGAPV